MGPFLTLTWQALWKASLAYNEAQSETLVPIINTHKMHSQTNQNKNKKTHIFALTDIIVQNKPVSTQEEYFSSA